MVEQAEILKHHADPPAIFGQRFARGGAAEYYGVTPDLTVLGKILGGGLPVGAVAMSTFAAA